jgi:16S rRNA C967 or C1407 C5-methylase (RsmB/RsmF family)
MPSPRPGEDTGDEGPPPLRPLHLPPFFLDWCAMHPGVQPTDLIPSNALRRYVRITSAGRALGTDLVIARLRDALSSKETTYTVERVPWLPDLHFYALSPPPERIAGLLPVTQGLALGQDISSAVAVHALDVQAGHHVLDMCCAPGGKMCLMAELVGPQGTVTGVDVSRERLSIAKGMLQRQGHGNFRLFAADAGTFAVHAPHRMGAHVRWTPAPMSTGDECRIKLFHAPQALRHATGFQHPELRYDRVLVDAECTGDGAVWHLLKHQARGWDKFAAQLARERPEPVEMLQRRILLNAFHLLAPGGLLVYSTCSMCIAQNEEVVAWLLQQCAPGEASVEPIPGSATFPTAPNPVVGRDELRVLDRMPTADGDAIRAHALRFTPRHSGTSGFFCVRIRKHVFVN